MTKQITGTAAISRAWVLARIIAYFVEHAGASAGSFQETTDLKESFGYNDLQWRAFADVINAWAWVIERGIFIPQHEMAKATKLGKLADLIWSKIAHG